MANLIRKTKNTKRVNWLGATKTQLREQEVSTLIHELEEASTFRNYYNCDGNSIQGYISELLMKASGTMLDLLVKIHNASDRLCGCCGVCPKDRQDPFNCEIVNLDGKLR